MTESTPDTSSSMELEKMETTPSDVRLDFTIQFSTGNISSCLSRKPNNSDKPVAIFCQQLAAWVQNIICNFYLLKNHLSALNSMNVEDGEKNKTDRESFAF
jgi:hypothetical protein